MNRIVIYLFLFSIVGRAQHTLTYSDGHVSPRASLVDVEWIAGYWQGTALGGITEENLESALRGFDDVLL